MLDLNELTSLAGDVERLHKAALPQDEWASDRKQVRWTPAEIGREAAIWYDDGDACAMVHDNLGLGIDGDAVAEFFAHSYNTAPRLAQLAREASVELRRLREENEALRQGVQLGPIIGAQTIVEMVSAIRAAQATRKRTTLQVAFPGVVCIDAAAWQAVCDAAAVEAGEIEEDEG